MRVLKSTVCILLMVTVLALSFSVYADDPEPSPTPAPTPQPVLNPTSDSSVFSTWMSNTTITQAIDDSWGALGVYGIWAILNGFGISVSVDGVSEWSDVMYLTIQSMLDEFLDTLPSINYTRWILPWEFGFTNTGLFTGNSTMLDDVESFVRWLQNKYSLQNNQSYTINAVTMIVSYNQEGVPVYIPTTAVDGDTWKVNYTGVRDPFEGLIGFQFGQVYQLVSGYYFRLILDNNNKVRMQICLNDEFVTLNKDVALLDISTFNRTWENARPQRDGWNGHNQVYVMYKANTSYNAFDYGFVTYAFTYNSQKDGGQMYQTATMSASEFLTYFMPQSMGTTFDTGVIVYPSEDPTYTIGDAVVVQNGDNIYIQVEISNVTVDNLPAVVSIGTIEPPELTTFYNPISALISYTSDAMAAIIGIMYEFPGEIIIPVYAIMGAIALFGIIKIMREH